MEIVMALFGVILILLVLWEGFETMILPRRVTRRFRMTRLFYRCTWRLWVKAVRVFVPAREKENILSFFGPFSLLLLLSVWAIGLISGFALIFWATGTAIQGVGGTNGIMTDFYLSGTTFFTLGLGDVVPHTTLTRALTVLEAGMGFAFLALIIGYLPALNQTFANREVSISLLDARAGSPPTAAEMLCRHGHERGMEALRQLLYEWERWSAEFLEGHLSYPVLAYFRSQHDNQSWLGALTAILDTSALVMTGVEGACERQAELTFAMARHAVVDLSLVFQTRPHEPRHNRLPADTLYELRSMLESKGIKLRNDPEADEKLAGLRLMYEPYLNALSLHLHMEIPTWIHPAGHVDNWQASAWGERGPGKRKSEQALERGGRHFQH
jgi:hypothetical protein